MKTESHQNIRVYKLSERKKPNHTHTHTQIRESELEVKRQESNASKILKENDSKLEKNKSTFRHARYIKVYIP